MTEVTSLLPITLGACAILLVILSGMHVGIALIALGLLSIHFILPRAIVGDAAYQAWIAVDNATLAAVVLYILMGELVLRSELGDRAFAALEMWLGRVPGGLLHSTIAFSGLFAAVSGSSVASAALLGTVAVPPMQARHYHPRLIYGAVAGGSTLGILIPPSIIMILYGYLAGESIAALFMAGIIPGILLALFFAAYIAIRTKLNPHLASSPAHSPSIRVRLRASLDLLPLLFLIVIILGGIYTGIWTPSEAAGGGCVAVLAILALYRRFSWSTLRRALYETLLLSSMILIVLAGSSIVSYIANYMQVPSILLEFIRQFQLNPYIVLILSCAMFYLLGCFIDGLSIVIITVPIIQPVMVSMGFDPVWYGVVFAILIEVSLITPPLGMNLFVLKGVVEGSQFRDIIAGALPYVGLLTLMLALLTVMPGIALWLPQHLQ